MGNTLVVRSATNTGVGLDLTSERLLCFSKSVDIWYPMKLEFNGWFVDSPQQHLTGTTVHRVMNRFV